MIYPTMSVMTFGAILLAILLMANWYVWRTAYTKRPRAAYPGVPRGTGPAVEGHASAVMEGRDDQQGFRRVA
jgi:hypothetical protein